MPFPDELNTLIVREIYQQVQNQLKALKLHYDPESYYTDFFRVSGQSLMSKLLFSYKRAEFENRSRVILNSIEAVQANIHEQLKALDQAIQEQGHGLAQLLMIQKFVANHPSIQEVSHASVKHNFSDNALIELRRMLTQVNGTVTGAHLLCMIDLCDENKSAASRLLMNGLSEGKISQLEDLKKKLPKNTLQDEEGTRSHLNHAPSLTELERETLHGGMKDVSEVLRVLGREGITMEAIEALDNQDTIVNHKVLQARFNMEVGGGGVLNIRRKDQSQVSEFTALIKALANAEVKFEGDKINIEFDSSVDESNQDKFKNLILGIIGVDAEKLELSAKPVTEVEPSRADFFKND